MSPPVSARRSRKGADTSARDDALKRLKSLREGERRSESGYQIRIEESIYDTVEEEDYKALVAKRREEDRFIADDEVEGYRDEGEEVDWSKGDLPPSSEESEGEGDKTKKKKLEKKKPPIKKPSSLLAAAALTGKHRLSAMFTSPAFKKSRDDKTNGFSVDSLVDDVIAEFAPDEADREKRRRGHLSSSVRTKGCAPIAPVKNIPVTKPELTMVKNNVAQTGSQENGDLGKQNTIREWKDEVVLCSEAASESSNELPHQVDLVTNERVDEEDPRKVIEAEVELAKRDGISLNAKIEVKKDSLLSATAAYRAELSGSNGNLGCDGGIADQSHTFEESKFELNSDGSMNFYIIDAYEFELNSDGTLYLFGKIQPPFLVLSTGSCQWHFRNSSVFRCNDSLSSTKFLNTAFDGMVPYSDSFGDSRSLNVKAGSAYHSCCVVVNNMQRCVYAIPNGSVFQTNVIMDLERDVVDSRISSTVLQTKLQEMASGLKGEISKKLLDLNVSTFSMTPVKRSYAFERSEVPIGEQHVLKVSYPFKDPALPSDFKGQHVSALFGTHSSALELLLIKRKIKGPSWLSISKFSSRAREMRVSWCKFEVVVNCFKDIRTSSSFDRLEIPPVIVSAINLKTIISGKQNVNEIVSASVICCCKAKSTISAGYLFMNNAHVIWESLRKGTQTLGMYYARLRSSWEELSHYNSFIEWLASALSEKIPTPPMGVEIYAKFVKKTRVFQFFTGLNPDFEYARVHLFDKIPFPTLEEAHAYCLFDQSCRSSMPHIFGIPSETFVMAVRYAYPVPPSVPLQTSHTSHLTFLYYPQLSATLAPRGRSDYCDSGSFSLCLPYWQLPMQVYTPGHPGRQPLTPDCQTSSVALGLSLAIDLPLSGIEPYHTSSLPITTDDDSHVSHSDDDRPIAIRKINIDTPMLASEWKRPGVLSHFTVVRNLEGVFPMGFTKEVADRNSKSGSVLATESNERALLNRLMLELHKLDSDVLVGHNISGFDLDVLLHRAQALKISSNTWSKIGRLKRSKMPKLTKGSTFFGSGASPGIMSCISGRLLCDTFLCSRVLLKEVSYSLTQLSKTQLNKDRKEIPPHDIPTKFQSSGSLLELVEYGETDAWLSMELMFHLSVLPLTRQLTNISGHLWGKTLQGARSQSVEYLLLHAFHAKKYIVPDKISKREKDIMSTKRKIAHSTEGGDLEEFNNGDLLENDTQQLNQGKAKKGPSYSGGLVLEPKKGLYDKYILLLDFNSLYPSIIQEYNICFTTVERSADGLIPRLPSSKVTGVLPELLKNLVERRKMVKSWLKNATGLKLQQLDIQQQALKLTANSMYGCLGSSNARFYAKPLAELITLQGREILQSTVDLVQNNLNLEVIYGDTDSIMIYSGLDDILQAKAIAGRVIQEVNKKYQRLEIDLDGLYKRMLLLKKKKYAAVKVQYKDGVPYEMIERKGLDMVRRDWSLLSKEIGDFCLSQILSGGSCEDVVEAIHNSLIKVQEDMRNGKVSLEKYVITKSLTKPPESYPDGKSQPHVQVALRLKEGGYRVGCSAGDTIPYVICREQGVSSSSSTGIAQRARHPEELEKDNGIWIVDIDYYLAQQIHPVVSRLCASIQGTSPARLADCLGLDSSRFQVKASEAANSDPSTSMFSVNDDERYNGCDPLRFTCPTCSGIFECPPLSSLVFKSRGEIPTKSEAEKEFNFNFWRKLLCPKCPDEGDRSRISPVIIANQYTEADLYKQLSYFCHVLDSERFLDKLDLKARIQAEVELDRVRPELVLAASTIQKIRDRCAYGWIQLSDLCVNV
ncbi:hypothetical protein GIB67_036966 [Kingdonia uniflora]|uniref:DNA polymerase n=1 Tax=Kingdonia uniflora TaxID=39325 RepID=A0A7J7NWM0_9MAGN|nr:hypothetical protein GIB67_036966 [Kingdonia uniflora]